MRAFALHDYIVARRLEKLTGKIDIIHAWPLGSLRTLKTAARLGIPTVIERPNAHTRFAYEVVRAVSASELEWHSHPGMNTSTTRTSSGRKRRNTASLIGCSCPSEFVVKTFLDKGFKRQQLIRHFYGVDEKVFYSGPVRHDQRLFTMIFVGVCAVRKGLHFALEAWLNSPACRNGTFLIAGSFIPAYEEKLRSMLSHPSVKVLGHREDA